ncbi:MAG TPA: DNA alkylation repair protein [Cytophagaceae bacterium]
MKRSSKAEAILSQINSKTKLGDLRKIAKDIKKDHELAMELWSTGEFLPRQLAILIMDNKLLSQDLFNKLDRDIQSHSFNERNQLMEWLIANQLSKDKKTIGLMESWANSPSTLQRRSFWYYQARLRGWDKHHRPTLKSYYLPLKNNRKRRTRSTMGHEFRRRLDWSICPKVSNTLYRSWQEDRTL